MTVSWKPDMDGWYAVADWRGTRRLIPVGKNYPPVDLYSWKDGVPLPITLVSPRKVMVDRIITHRSRSDAEKQIDQIKDYYEKNPEPREYTSKVVERLKAINGREYVAMALTHKMWKPETGRWYVVLDRRTSTPQDRLLLGLFYWERDPDGLMVPKSFPLGTANYLDTRDVAAHSSRAEAFEELKKVSEFYMIYRPLNGVVRKNLRIMNGKDLLISMVVNKLRMADKK